MSDLIDKLSTVRLPGVVVMLINSRLIAGTKRATPEEIELALGAKFTQDAVYTNGSVRVLPKDNVDKLVEHKRKLESLLKKEGFQFAGGYAIAEDRAEEVYADAMRICAEFNAARQKLSVEVTEVTKQYAATQPRWESVILARGYSVDDVGACSLHVNPMRVELAQQCFEGAGPLLAAYAEEVASEAEDWLDELHKRGHANRKALSPLKRWAEKASQYEDVSLKSLSHRLCAFINAFPSRGNVEGELLAKLKGLYETLKTPAGVIAYAAAKSGEGASLQLFDETAQGPRAAAATEEAGPAPLLDALGALAEGKRPQGMASQDDTEVHTEPAKDTADAGNQTEQFFFLEVA